MQWPAIMSILLIAMNLWIYSVDKRAGIIMSLCVAVYIVIVGVLYFYNKTIIFSDLVDFAAQYGSVQNVLLKDLQFPYAILLEDGQIIWNNTCFSAVFGNEAKAGTYLSKYIPVSYTHLDNGGWFWQKYGSPNSPWYQGERISAPTKDVYKRQPVGENTLGRIFNVLGEPIDEKPAPTDVEYEPIHRKAPTFEEQATEAEMLETGIKVVDLLCPYQKGGKIGLFGGAGVGKTVLIQELITNIAVSYTHLAFSRQEFVNFLMWSMR